MSSSAAAEAVANIEELLTQILVSVPLRSVARFMCVSKHWYSLISNLHTLKNPKMSAFFSSKTEAESFKSLPLGNPEIPSGWNPFTTFNDSFNDGSRLKIIQSCNGLFLCIPESREHRDFVPRKQHDLVYVVNPTTNKFLALSSPTARFRSFVRYALAFEPSKSPHYTLVCVTTHYRYSFVEGEGKYHKIHIYSSKSGKWKHVIDIPFFQSLYDRCCHPDLKKWHMDFDRRSREGSVYCNGAVHWIRERNAAELPFCCEAGKFFRQEADVLHYFDIGEERLRLVAATPPVPLVVENMPVEDIGSDLKIPIEFPILVHRYFGECGGRLYLIDIYKHCHTQFDVMEMERDYSGWFVKYHVDLNPVVMALPQHDLNPFVILCLSREKEKDDDEFGDSSTILLLHMPGKVISYNLMNKNFKTSIELANKNLYLAIEDTSFRDEVDNYPYMESLACV
ncbi:F-box protein At5g07610-like [Rosa rugosa]|uniref:F-box protein At5g07610-like n=1 Tax=Rosa rugosa TaxID=74645 RepID=UPI002B406AA6|nr:F-box protein At5g07610-like [Rosa rugosa]